METEKAEKTEREIGFSGIRVIPSEEKIQRKWSGGAMERELSNGKVGARTNVGQSPQMRKMKDPLERGIDRWQAPDLESRTKY